MRKAKCKPRSGIHTSCTLFIALALAWALAFENAPFRLAADDEERPGILPAEPSAEAQARMRDPKLVLVPGDTLRMNVSLPDRKYGALETIEKNGEVATPDGSFIRAGGLTLERFRTDLANLYKDVRGFENAVIEVYVHSSPYKVVKAKPASNEPALLIPRVYRAPLTLWQAIQNEGGVPAGVDASKIHVLRRNLDRKSFNCGGLGGAPDGNALVASGDVIFLVPPGTPLHGIFE